MNELPPGWIVSTLGEAFRWGSGGTPASHQPEYYGGGIPWVVIGDLRDGVVSTTEETLSQSGLANSAAKLVPAGSVLLAMYGSIGKLAIAGCELTTNQAIAFTYPPAGISAKYLYYFLSMIRSRLVLAGKGGTQRNISQTVIKGVPFLCAPTGEQIRIVECLDGYLSCLDAAVASLERVQAKLKTYRASVLKAAVEGRLVPTEAELARQENRDYEPAQIVLDRILKERRRRWEEAELARLTKAGKPPKDDKWKASYEEPTTPEMGEQPFRPEGWCWANLDQVAEVRGGVTKGQQHRSGQQLLDVPYLRVANVQRGYLELGEMKTIAVTEDQIDELRLKHGDVLFNEGGDRDKLGRGWIWEGQLETCIHQNHVFRARIVTSDLSAKFVSWYGNSAGQTFFFNAGKQTTNLASINLTMLKSLPIPLPPINEQRRIAEEVERLLSILEESETETQHCLARCSRLRQSVLAWAFEGRLVDQDPTEEPADRLLARIQAERATLPRTKNPRLKKTKRP